ncbi:MAG: amidohydrolase family protein [Spirochaetaceae bacterium]|jgi:dihydroorotase|nr:amidohydrolase family protein [Spirochaetaceae bacterium]
MKTVFAHFRIVDAAQDVDGAIVVEDGLIKQIVPHSMLNSSAFLAEIADADHYIDGTKLKHAAPPHEPHVIMPAFIDLHAHFRDPGFPQKETLESATLAAVKGGYTTLVCMANTSPPTDTLAAAAALKARSDALGLIDLYPAMSLTKGMEGKELTDIPHTTLTHEGGSLPPGSGPAVLHHPPLRGPGPRNAPATPQTGTTINPRSGFIRILSEDGKDIHDAGLFAAALRAAAEAGIPVSCHCDRDGENAATERALRLAKETGATIHIAHVSTKEAVAMIAAAKKERPGKVTAEATPHHFFLNDWRADELGPDTFGKVAPPLRSEADRKAVLEAILDGTIDIIATDHAPHTDSDKEAGAPGFSGLETAFAVACTALVASGESDLCHLSQLMAAAPASILSLEDRGLLEPGRRADFAIVQHETLRTIDKASFRSRGKNTPFHGMELSGMVFMTVFGGKIVYEF